MLPPFYYYHFFKVFFGLSTGWIVSLALCVPPLLKIVPYGYIDGLTSCSSTQKYEKGVLIYSAIYTVFTLLIPATLIICCNLKVIKTFSLCHEINTYSKEIFQR